MSRSKPRVAVLYNAPTLSREHADFASEAGVVAAARAVASALKSEGFKSWPMAARRPLARLIRTLSRRKPDVVFNLVEGFGGQSGGEAWVTSLLEMLGLPYTGCPPEAQALCLKKSWAKAVLSGTGLPVGPWIVHEPDDPRPDPDWPPPHFVKPESEDGSLGIDQGSVVADLDDLPAAVGRVRAAHGPRVLIEPYLPGPEYNVGVIALPDPTPLPVAEIAYDVPPGHWPILTYAAKWAAGSAEDLASPPRCPADVAPALADQLGRLAVMAFRATGCRDIARVDFRMDAGGRPMILEVNPNPDLDPSAGWARALRASGRDYAGTLAAMARQAHARPPHADRQEP